MLFMVYCTTRHFQLSGCPVYWCKNRMSVLYRHERFSCYSWFIVQPGTFSCPVVRSTGARIECLYCTDMKGFHVIHGLLYNQALSAVRLSGLLVQE